MANFKANRTEEDILREMTAILRELKDPRIDPMLTVVRAELSRDLSDCKIFVSSLSGKETAKESTACCIISSRRWKNRRKAAQERSERRAGADIGKNSRMATAM